MFNKILVPIIGSEHSDKPVKADTMSFDRIILKISYSEVIFFES